MKNKIFITNEKDDVSIELTRVETLSLENCGFIPIRIGSRCFLIDPNNKLFGTISSFGNPAVWWICFAGTVFMLILLLSKRFKLNTDLFFILCCMTSSILPWMFITRSVYIYHYFATVPMIILASVYVFKHYEDKFYYVPKELGRTVTGAAKFFPNIKYIWIAAAIILFAVFYPVISGIPVERSYIDSLQWLPTWTFRGIWPSIYPN